jgi:hypothetical protein
VRWCRKPVVAPECVYTCKRIPDVQSEHGYQKESAGRSGPVSSHSHCPLYDSHSCASAQTCLCLCAYLFQCGMVPSLHTSGSWSLLLRTPSCLQLRPKSAEIGEHLLLTSLYQHLWSVVVIHTQAHNEHHATGRVEIPQTSRRERATSSDTADHDSSLAI